MANLLIYGATGYTGSLIAREAIGRNIRPIIAGRSTNALAALAGELGLEHRVFALDVPAEIDAGLGGIHTVLNCAGPFSRTARPMADACLRTKVNYLDITGEIAVFEHLASRDADARTAGVVLLPGVGFDVVPSDCLAVHLKQRLPSANRLVLAFRSSGRMSRGTMLTGLERATDGGMIRENGKLKPVPTAWRTRTIDFGDGPVRAMTIPWGDVATAFHSTGIPNIEVYLAAPFAIRAGATQPMVRLAIANALGAEPTASPDSRRHAWPRRSGAQAKPLLVLGRGRRCCWATRDCPASDTGRLRLDSADIACGCGSRAPRRCSARLSDPRDGLRPGFHSGDSGRYAHR